jgi:hypothetical protein
MGVRKRIRPKGYGLDFSLLSLIYASQNISNTKLLNLIFLSVIQIKL